MPTMPFGRHKGESIENVPRQYLEWFVENVKGNEPLKIEIRKLLGFHENLSPPVLLPREPPVPVQEFVIPRGKWKGTKIGDIPDGSLEAVLNGFNGAGPKAARLVAMLQDEKARRKKAGRSTGKYATGFPRIERHGSVTVKYCAPTYREVDGFGVVPPWPDGWGSPENHERNGAPPFDASDPLTEEFRAIVS